MIGLERRRNPEAFAEIGQGLDEGFAVVEEAACDADAKIFVFGCSDRGPIGRPGGGDWRGVHSSIDAGNEVELPGAAVNLPDTEPREPGNGEKDEGEKTKSGKGRAASGAARNRHGISLIAAGVGAMLRVEVVHDPQRAAAVR